MSIEHTISQIALMSIEDQLRIINSVWDRMGDDVAKLTESQRRELDDRMEKFRQNPDSALTDSELRAKLESRREGN